VADAKKPADKPEEKPAPPKLARAGESGDPAVQWLLAERLTWTSVGNKDKVAELDAQLAERGFTAQ
jgi:hypothetical protein